MGLDLSFTRQLPGRGGYWIRRVSTVEVAILRVLSASLSEQESGVNHNGFDLRTGAKVEVGGECTRL